MFWGQFLAWNVDESDESEDKMAESDESAESEDEMD